MHEGKILPGLRLVGTFLLSAACYFFSFPPFGLFPLAWVAPLPLLLSGEKLSARGWFLLWWLWGSAFFLASLSWLPGTIESYAPVTPWQAFLAYTALAVYLGLYWGVWAWCSCLFLRVIPGFLALSIPFGLLEYVRGHLLTGFPWLLAAHSQAPFKPFIQGAALVGVYGLSFLLAWIWGGLWELIRGDRRLALLSLALPMLLTLWGLVRLGDMQGGNPFDVAIVQPNNPPRTRWNPAWARREVMRTVAMVRRVCRRGELVVLPESAVPGYLFEDPEDTRPFLEGLRGCRSYMVVGTNHWEFQKGRVYLRNRAYLVSPQGKEEGYYDKLHLVPFGEFVPLGRYFPFLYVLAGYRIGYLPGKKGKLLPFPLSPLGIQICYEAIFPGLARAQVRKGAGLLVNITNDAWLGKTLAPYQHLTGALFRAVENGRWMIRCSNSGISTVISPSGRVVASIPLFTRGVLKARVYRLSFFTPYTVLGDWLPFMCGLGVFLLLLREGFKSLGLFDKKL